MPRKNIQSDKISKPNGHFAQATMIEARGRLVFISGMTSRRPDGVIAGIGLSNDVHGRLLAPSSEGQLRAMRAAYEAAGWTPAVDTSAALARLELGESDLSGGRFAALADVFIARVQAAGALRPDVDVADIGLMSHAGNPRESGVPQSP